MSESATHSPPSRLARALTADAVESFATEALALLHAAQVNTLDEDGGAECLRQIREGLIIIVEALDDSTVLDTEPLYSVIGEEKD